MRYEGAGGGYSQGWTGSFALLPAGTGPGDRRQTAERSTYGRGEGVATSVYVENAEVVAVLRSRGLDSRADWVGRQLPAFIDILQNAALFQTLGIDPQALPHSDGATEGSSR